MTAQGDNGRQTVQYGNEQVGRGQGGESHQFADDGRPRLTTQQGAPGRRRPELAAGRRARPGAAGGLPLPREDLPLRPRAHPRAGRPCARLRRARLLRELRAADRHHPGRPLPASRARRRPRSSASRPSPGNKGSADLARDVRGFAVKFYTKRGQLGPRRQQHPGLLHPGRDQVPRPDPRRQAGAGPRLPAGADRARQLLGLHLAHAREHAHGHVDHVRPGDPALVPVHGRLRRPHLPPGQRRGQVDLRQVPLEAEAGPAVGRLERGGQDQRRRPRLPSPRPVGRDRAGRLPRVGARAAALRRGLRRAASTSTSSTPTKLIPEEQVPVRPVGRLVLDRRRRQLLRRDRAGRVLHAEHRPRHRLHQRPAAAGPQLLLPRHPAQAARAARTSPTSRSTRRNARSRTSSRTATWRCTTRQGRANYEPNSWGGATAVRARTRRRASPVLPGARWKGRSGGCASESFADHYSQARQFYISQTDRRADGTSPRP